MNDQQRAAMQIALETLCNAVKPKQGNYYSLTEVPIDCAYKYQQAITALREALAQPQGESVSLPCCGYTNPEAIKWNQFNGVVQCHNCGQVYNTTPPSVEAAIETKTTQHGGEYPIYTQQDMDDAIAETLEKAAKVCEERSDEMKRRAEGELLTNLGKTVALEKAKTLDMCAAAIRSMK